MKYVLLAVGLIFLVKGADLFVTGASSVARRFHIPSLVIGLTIVAFGTSAPEVAVSVTSALNGQSDITMGNIIGSNMFNLLVVVGMAAWILPFKVKETIIAKEFPFMLLSCVAVLILAFDLLLGNGTVNVINRTDGLVLLMLFAIFLYYLLSVALKAQKENQKEEVMISIGLTKSIVYLVVGIVAIVLGGNLAVDAATEIALAWGMSETMVGLTIIAAGTSLPELMTSVVAAKKGESDIALGNVIGSNIFNVFFIMGISAVITPVSVSAAVAFDAVLLTVITLIAFIFALTDRKFSKGEGIVLFLMYVAYMIFVIWRN
ncbi:MAG: calcium/sodium antiporter [Peptococcaceae bacterium]